MSQHTLLAELILYKLSRTVKNNAAVYVEEHKTQSKLECISCAGAKCFFFLQVWLENIIDLFTGIAMVDKP